MSMTIEPGTHLGPYEIRDPLGEGGMASVYKAWHSGLHRFEALKIPRGGSNADAAFVQRLLTEARLAAGLRHPHIVAIHAVSEPNAPVPYFAMEWIEGEDLSHLLKQGFQLSTDETLAILSPVAAALDFAHARGVIHRDIKPANILLRVADPRGTESGASAAKVPMVVDFGISRAADEDDGATRLTRSGMFVGTPEYMSPEQSGSGDSVEAATDQYSLAVLAYEMLCGRPPFTAGPGVSRLAILVQHVRDLPERMESRCPGLPAPATDVVMRALSKNPAARFPSCTAFISALGDALEGPVGLASEGSAPGCASGRTAQVPDPFEAHDLATRSGMPVPPSTRELSPFDATQFAQIDQPTLMERVSPTSALPLTAPLPVAPPVAPLGQAEGAVPQPTSIGNPSAGPEMAAAAAVVPRPPAIGREPVQGSQGKSSTLPISLLAGTGGLIAGAVIVYSIMRGPVVSNTGPRVLKPVQLSLATRHKIPPRWNSMPLRRASAPLLVPHAVPKRPVWHPVEAAPHAAGAGPAPGLRTKTALHPRPAVFEHKVRRIERPAKALAPERRHPETVRRAPVRARRIPLTQVHAYLRRPAHRSQFDAPLPP